MIYENIDNAETHKEGFVFLVLSRVNVNSINIGCFIKTAPEMEHYPFITWLALR